MSVSLEIKAFAGKDSEEFKKHFKAVIFCIQNELSYPKETSEFFKGKVDGNDLEEINTKYIIDYISNGVEVPINIGGSQYEKRIKVKDIPKEVDEIIIKLS